MEHYLIQFFNLEGDVVRESVVHGNEFDAEYVANQNINNFSYLTKFQIRKISLEDAISIMSLLGGSQ